jgi:hypothetical protein
VRRHFVKPAVPDGECGPCPVFALYPGIRLTAEEKSWKNLSLGKKLLYPSSIQRLDVRMRLEKKKVRIMSQIKGFSARNGITAALIINRDDELVNTNSQRKPLNNTYNNSYLFMMYVHHFRTL